MDQKEDTFSAYWFKKNTWPAGQAINVYFKNGIKEENAITKFYMMEWARYGNFTFDFKKGEKTTDEEAVIIQFDHSLTKKGICG